MLTTSSISRARFARRGLASRAPIDPTTHAMLLRQLYLAHFEGRRFQKAHEIALQALELDVLPDVIHQDVARAALAEGQVDDAIDHLRVAARRGPASRRPFHLWTLGGTLFLAQRYAEAIGALTRAARWGTRDRPLYKAHLALAQISGGVEVDEDDVQATIDELAEAPCGQGYGRFVLGHLAYAAGRWDAAKKYLDAFVRRTEAGRPAAAIALAGEVRMARATLAKMRAN